MKPLKAKRYIELETHTVRCTMHIPSLRYGAGNEEEDACRRICILQASSGSSSSCIWKAHLLVSSLDNGRTASGRWLLGLWPVRPSERRPVGSLVFGWRILLDLMAEELSRSLIQVRSLSHYFQLASFALSLAVGFFSFFSISSLLCVFDVNRPVHDHHCRSTAVVAATI